MKSHGRFLFVALLTVVLAACGGNGGSSQRQQQVRDTTPPTISLACDNPQVMAFGEAYVELGAIASDSIDGDLTTSIVIDATSIDPATPGDYTVTYNVTDAAGNAAVTVTRTVTVQPPIPEKAEVSVAGDIKQLIFTWDAVEYTEYYRLMENPDGHSGFTQLGDDIPAGTLTATQDIAVHLYDWVNAQYLIETCNVTGCASSDVVTATDVMLDTIGYFKASNTGVEDQFGFSVSLSADGRTVAVGGPFEASGASGIDGDESDDSVAGAGAVFVFGIDGDHWSQHAYVKASNPGSDHLFGYSVAISADGATLAVGAPGENSDQDPTEGPSPGAGAVYIFRLNDTTWSQETMLKPSNREGGQEFGRSVTLSSDGSRVAIGAPADSTSFDGKCYTGDDWRPPPPTEVCEGSGAAYVFAFDGAGWNPEAYIKDHANHEWGRFGHSVILSDSGDLLAIGEPGLVATVNPAVIGLVSVYRYDAAGWVRSSYFYYWDESDSENTFIDLLALSGDGQTLATVIGIGFDYEDDRPEWDCAVRVYRFDGVDWTEQDTVWTDDPRQSCNIGRADISADGNVIAAGGRKDHSNAIGIDGDRYNDLAEWSGAIDVYEFNGLEWVTSYVKASNTGAFDYFSQSVALSADGNTLVVGAQHEDSSATGINGDQTDNSAEASGAVYVY